MNRFTVVKRCVYLVCGFKLGAFLDIGQEYGVLLLCR